MRRIPIQLGGSSDYALMVSCNGDGPTPIGGLAVFDGNKVESIDSQISTGMCTSGDHLYRLLQTPGSEGMIEMLVYNAEGIMKVWRLKDVADPHDVIWDGKHLIVVSTADNSVKWIAPGGDVVREWKVQADIDAWHLNCLAFHDAQVFVSAFGKFDEHRGWARDTHKETGILIQPETGQTVISGLLQPHSPRYIDGSWIICNSLSREVCEYSTTGQLIRRSEPLALYARGMAITDDFLFVGESMSRNMEYADGDMPGTTASIAVLSRDNWTLVDRIPVPYREIYELVLVDRSLANAVQRQAVITHYEARLANTQHRAEAEIDEIRRCAEAELAQARRQADTDAAEVGRRSKDELEAMEAVISGLQWQIDWMKSSRGVRLILRARAARGLLRQKGWPALAKRALLSMTRKPRPRSREG